MARISGINLPNHKHIWVALTSIYGIGDTRAKHICDKVGIEATKKVKDLDSRKHIGLRCQQHIWVKLSLKLRKVLKRQNGYRIKILKIF